MAEIIITGADGFLGSYLLRELSRTNQVTGFDIKNWDIRNPLTDKIKADIVIHCASKVDNAGPYQEYYETNVIGTENVINSIEFKKFIYISSSSVYIGSKYLSPYKESYTDLNPLNNYSRTKLLAEKLVAEKVTNHYILRPRILYGPGTNPLFEKLLESRVFGRVVLPTDGKHKTSITSLETILHGVNRIISNELEPGIYNIADKKGYKIQDLIKKLCLERKLKEPIFLLMLSKTPLRELINIYGRLAKGRILIDDYVLSNLNRDNVLECDIKLLSEGDAL